MQVQLVEGNGGPLELAGAEAVVHVVDINTHAALVDAAFQSLASGRNLLIT